MSDWFSWSLLYYLSEWVVRIVMLFIIPQRRHPNSAMAWLLVIFFLPWPGLALYWLIGSNRLPKRRIAMHTRMLDRLRAASQRLENYPLSEKGISPICRNGPPGASHKLDLSPFPTAELGARATEAVKLAEHLGYMPILGGNDVELIAETETFIDRLVADIDAAQKHVHLLFYIFAGDDTGRRVIDALTRAVRRGVKCRVLVDGVGSRQLLKRWGKRIRAEGIELHEALPVGLFRRRMARLDLRNHRKLAVIDGRIGYTGSQNIVDAGYGRKDLAWYDLMLRLRGPILLELQEVFVTDWHFETDEVLDDETIFPDPEPAGQIAVQTLPSGPNYPTENYQRMVVAAIHAAERRVAITTPYFVPDDPFLQALETAVLRGVEVELVVPRKVDQRLVGAASRSYWDDLLAMGVKLYLYDKGLLHAKTMCVDDAIAFIGSSNFDIRSFALNFEINLLFYGPEVAEQLRRQQGLYLRDSFQLTAERWARRSKAKTLFENVARLLSPLL